MGTYLGVNAVEKIGTPVIPTKDQPMTFGNMLIMVLDNGLWKVAADVTNKREYDDFYASYALGNWLQIRLFSLTVEQAKACPDEGRVESTYFTEQRGKI
jgi:hypothetical protein